MTFNIRIKTCITWVAFMLIALIFIGCNNAKDNSLKKYDRFLFRVFEKGHFNGNVLVIKNGEPVYQGAFGTSNLDSVDSLQLSSVFRLASVSKQFTAMGIMLLKDAGELSYDQDIKYYIPKLPYEGISIRHLLNHVSGLPDYVNLMDHSWKPELKYNDPERLISGNDDIINSLVEEKPDILFPAGERFEYSNTGYVLLATIIERVSGLPFGQFLNERVFTPTGMESTLVYDYIPGPDPSMPFKVFGYVTDKESEDRYSLDAHYLNGAQGDGGIYSTVQDLARWDRILYTDELVKRETLEEAFMPARLNNGEFTNYGFGWFFGESPTHRKVVEHGGGWVGFRTYIYREIEENNCIILLSNNSCEIMPMMLKVLKKILHN